MEITCEKSNPYGIRNHTSRILVNNLKGRKLVNLSEEKVQSKYAAPECLKYYKNIFFHNKNQTTAWLRDPFIRLSFIGTTYSIVLCPTGKVTTRSLFRFV